MKEQKLASNLWKMNLIRAFRSFVVFMPVIVLFFQEHGLNMQQVLMLEAFFSVSLLVCELPSGYFSDRFGRKISIVLGSVLASLAFGVYSFANGFWEFLVAELILGVSLSFISGADSALIYDTLVDLGRTDDYKKAEGRYTSAGLLSEGVASLLGGVIALVSLRATLWVEAVVSLFAIPMALSLIEPKRHVLESQQNEVKKMITLVKYSLHEHKEIKWLIIYSSVVSGSTLTMVWFIQPLWQQREVPLVLFGVLWAVLFFSASVFSFFAHRFEKMMGKKLAFILLLSAPVVGYLGLSVWGSAWASSLLLLFYFVRGVSNPVIADYLNGLVSSEIRATILSVKNLVGRIIFSIVGPFIGWVNDVYTLPMALAASGIIFFLLGAVSLLFMQKHKLL